MTYTTTIELEEHPIKVIKRTARLLINEEQDAYQESADDGEFDVDEYEFEYGEALDENADLIYQKHLEPLTFLEQMAWLNRITQHYQLETNAYYDETRVREEIGERDDWREITYRAFTYPLLRSALDREVEKRVA